MSAPKVFISYSHETPEHKRWVAALATDLRGLGVDVTLDEWDMAPGQDIAAFMEQSVTSADRVILVCTSEYVIRANTGAGGVGYEKLIVSAELIGRIDSKKFVPVVRQASSPRTLPTYMGARFYIDFSDDSKYKERLDELARELHGVRSQSKPPLGVNPYASVAPLLDSPARLAGPTGLTSAGREIISDEWFASRAKTAHAGLARIERTGAMETRFALHEPTRKSQIELLNAVRISEIHTFGWPFAVTLENRDEFKPRPETDGIRAEIEVTGKGPLESPAYDFWYARTNGDFYALQSLFEDERQPNAVFFNTRIVRVTEALMFASNFYQNLGVPADARVSIQITHYGLRGRTLTSSSPNRHVFARTTTAPTSESQIVDEVGKIRENLVAHVKQVTAPMFQLFEFAEFADSVYTDIVRNFEQGRVT